MADDKWKLVTEYKVARYQCGLAAGDTVQLIKDLVIRNHRGKPTGKVNPKGERWTVLHGAADDPGIVWLRESNGDRHTWDDDPSIFEWFEKVE